MYYLRSWTLAGVSFLISRSHVVATTPTMPTNGRRWRRHGSLVYYAALMTNDQLLLHMAAEPYANVGLFTSRPKTFTKHYSSNSK
jgi:hypothetical protein